MNFNDGRIGGGVCVCGRCWPGGGGFRQSVRPQTARPVPTAGADEGIAARSDSELARIVGTRRPRRLMAVVREVD